MLNHEITRDIVRERLRDAEQERMARVPREEREDSRRGHPRWSIVALRRVLRPASAS